MELRRYGQVLAERWAVVVGTFAVALVIAAASVYLTPSGSATYASALSLAVRPQAIPVSSIQYFSDDYYSYVASEYANDDLISIIESDDFLQSVRARLPGGPNGAPNGSIKAKKAHRIVDITVTSSSAEGGQQLAAMVATMLTGPEAQSSYFSLFTNRIENVTVVNAPRTVAQPVSRNALFNVAARALVGLVAGLCLAFLFEYLDDSVAASDIEGLLGWSIVGEIPGRGLPRPGAVRPVRSVADPGRPAGR